MQNKKEYIETGILNKIRTSRGLACQVLFIKTMSTMTIYCHLNYRLIFY